MVDLGINGWEVNIINLDVYLMVINVNKEIYSSFYCDVGCFEYYFNIIR